MRHFLDSTKKKIVGRKFLAAEKLSSDRIRVALDDGYFDVIVEGDCCSTSAFYDLTAPNDCIGEEIIDVLEKVENDHPHKTIVYEAGFGRTDFNDDWHYLSIWDIELHTKSGKILLRHVNDSNGYYDGYTMYEIY